MKELIKIFGLVGFFAVLILLSVTMFVDGNNALFRFIGVTFCVSLVWLFCKFVKMYANGDF